MTLRHDGPPQVRPGPLCRAKKEVRVNPNCEIRSGGLGPSRGLAAPCAPAVSVTLRGKAGLRLRARAPVASAPLPIYSSRTQFPRICESFASNSRESHGHEETKSDSCGK